MSSDQTSSSDILQYRGILLGIIGVLGSFVFAGIIFILGFDPINALLQVALFMLYLAFLSLLGSGAIILADLFEKTYRTRAGHRKSKTSLGVKVGNTLFFSGQILMLISVPVLFFARDLFYLGVASIILAAIFLIFWYFRIWRPRAKGISFM